MKKYLIILLTFSLLFLFGCEKSEIESIQTPTEEAATDTAGKKGGNLVSCSYFGDFGFEKPLEPFLITPGEGQEGDLYSVSFFFQYFDLLDVGIENCINAYIDYSEISWSLGYIDPPYVVEPIILQIGLGGGAQLNVEADVEYVMQIALSNVNFQTTNYNFGFTLIPGVNENELQITGVESAGFDYPSTIPNAPLTKGFVAFFP